jgi:hypothetical protein
VYSFSIRNIITYGFSLVLGSTKYASFLKTSFASRCTLDVLGENWDLLRLLSHRYGYVKVTFTLVKFGTVRAYT